MRAHTIFTATALASVLAPFAACGSGGDAPVVIADDGAVIAAPDSGTSDLPHFSFFVTSLAALQALSGNPDGFGGDLSYGETGAGAGLRGADKLCAAIAERSLPGASAKQWHAFLSVSDDGTGHPVDAIDRIGDGPWYDRQGRVVASSKADLLFARPENADAAIQNDLPNEDGVPNHQPDLSADAVDNHHMLTGSTTTGTLYAANATCKDWTARTGDASEGKPRVGLAWPRGGGGGGDGSRHWMSALSESGCAPGVSIIEMGPPNQSNPTVGSGGGYGGFYCFAEVP